MLNKSVELEEAEKLEDLLLKKKKELSELYAEKQKKLNELKELTSRIRELKRERLNLFKRIAELKDERVRVKDEISKHIEDLKLLRSKRSILLRRAGKPENELRKIYEELEWKYQTTPTLPREDDRRLVLTIENVKARLAVYEEIRGIDAQISVKERQIEALRGQLNTLQDSIRSLIERVNSIRQEIANLTGEVNKVGDILKPINIRVKSLKEDVRRVSEELSIKRREMILTRLKDLERRNQEALIQRRRIAEEAKEKISRGERLNFDEFKALVEAGNG
ncbi:MAG: hypothetical protein QW651_00400 [Candidatus Nezhaarchaeales archaeon]